MATAPFAIPLTQVEAGLALTINCPQLFARPDFMQWLTQPGNQVFTWHRPTDGPVAGEYSDVVVLVDTNYEGDSSTMPQDLWVALCDVVYKVYGVGLPHANHQHVAVRLTNL